MSTTNVTTRTTAPVWLRICWKQAKRIVANLRQRIYRASAQGDVKRAGKLQRLLLRARSTALLAIRQITQVNRGRRTPGVDKVVVETDQQRAQLLELLRNMRREDIKPVRRVYIKKRDGRKRPLGLPTILDRCKQAIIRMALEPFWEAKFAATSYGFRPGRSAQDAIARIHLTCNCARKRHFVLDTDIEGAFDHVSQAFLMKKIGAFPARQWVHGYLQAGVMEQRQWQATPAGTPQGGPLSPLLLNIALHGMDEALGIQYDSRGHIKPQCHALVTYADDLVVFGHTRQACEQAQQTLDAWLAERGLRLSKKKTRIAHLREGFDFLGFTIRHYRTRTAKRGWACLIKPSQEAVKAFKKNLKEGFKKVRTWALQEAIAYLNPQIVGWANYYRTGNSKRTFSKLDAWIWGRQERFARRRHPNKPRWWIHRRYWGHMSSRANKWVFRDAGSGHYMWKLAWTNIRYHCVIKGNASPDNPELREYWQKRRNKKAHTGTWKQRVLWKRQQGLCVKCGGPLDDGENIDQHHIQHKRNGGQDRLENLQLMHTLCHQQEHRQSRIGLT